MKDTNSIWELLSEMQSLLIVAGKTQWADSIEVLAKRFAVSSSSDEAKNVAREALQMYGGMGSLSDLVLYDEGRPSEEWNERFDVLRHNLYRELVDLITNSSVRGS